MKRTKLNQEKSEALQIAHRLKKKGYSLSHALQTAWSGIRLKRLMRKTVVQITFQKKDGTITTRLATLKSDVLPMRKRPVTPANYRRKASEKITYFELSEKGNCYKSFLPQNLRKFEVMHPAVA